MSVSKVQNLQTYNSTKLRKNEIRSNNNSYNNSISNNQISFGMSPAKNLGKKLIILITALFSACSSNDGVMSAEKFMKKVVLPTEKKVRAMKLKGYVGDFADANLEDLKFTIYEGAFNHQDVDTKLYILNLEKDAKEKLGKKTALDSAASEGKTIVANTMKEFLK